MHLAGSADHRVEAAGYEAIVLTVDAPSHGARDRLRRAGGDWPAHVRAVNLAGLPAAEPLSTEAPRKPDAAGPGRNDPCPCGSGKKYKKCCGAEAADKA